MSAVKTESLTMTDQDGDWVKFTWADEDAVVTVESKSSTSTVILDESDIDDLRTFLGEVLDSIALG